MAEVAAGRRGWRPLIAGVAALALLGVAGPGVAAAQPQSQSKPRARATTSAQSKPHRGAKPAARHPKPRPVPPLTGWLAAGARFPRRAVVLQPPAGHQLTAGTLHVTENGSPVGSPTLTPLTDPQPGDLGLVVAVDQSTSMRSDGLSAAMSAVGQLDTTRTRGEELGLVTFDARPTVFLPLTGSESRIHHVLGLTPWTGPGDDVAAAETIALAQLTTGQVASGAIIVVSDGVDISAPGSELRALQARAAAAHVTVATIGLADRAATPQSLHALAATAPAGTYHAATPATLGATLAAVTRGLTRGYVLRYRSSAPSAQHVTVTITAAGIPGTVTGVYRSPHAAASPLPTVRPASAKHSPSRSHAAKTFDLQSVTQLSPTPSFAPPPLAVPPPASTGPAGGFWTSTFAVPAVAALCALLIGAAISLILHRPSKRAIQARVGKFIPVEGNEELTLTREKPTGLFRALQRGSWWPPFVEAVEVARSPHSPVMLVRRAAIVGLICAIALTVISGSVLLGLLPLIAWPFVLRAMILRAADKQRARFRETLPTYLQDLASSIRVGRSLVSALSAIAEGADEPMRSELERAVTDEALGRPLEQCLEGISYRMQSTDMDQVALIAGLNRKSGANIAESLERVAEGARERADLYREMKALTAQAKMSSLVLTGLPGVLLVALALISPTYAHPLLHTTIGIVMVALGAVMVFSGWKVMNKLTNVGAV